MTPGWFYWPLILLRAVLLLLAMLVLVPGAAVALAALGLDYVEGWLRKLFNALWDLAMGNLQ